MELTRRKFQGVLNILSFNRHFYILGLAALILFIVVHTYFDWPPIILTLVVAAFLYGLLMPLIVSAYVYDFSGFYNFQWLNTFLKDEDTVKLIMNINAGFDETSFIIHHKFPEAELRVFDFYNPKRHTEPAIKRARKVSLIYPNTQVIESNAIPMASSSVDTIFLLSAVHEIRTHKEKVQFLNECKRVCAPGGKVIMVEHLRDLPNFLAFTIGFTHFFSRAAWKKAFMQAGFSTFRESKFTPFMSVFNCSH